MKKMIEYLSAKSKKTKRVQAGGVSVAPGGYQRNKNNYATNQDLRVAPPNKVRGIALCAWLKGVEKSIFAVFHQPNVKAKVLTP
jgi:hypothetical protein